MQFDLHSTFDLGVGLSKDEILVAIDSCSVSRS